MNKKAKSKLMQFGILLAVLLICIPFIHSAGETVVYTKTNETISIKAVGGTSAIDLQLIENSYQCGGTQCYAIIKITPKISINTALTATVISYNWTFRENTKDGKTTNKVSYALYSNTTYANGSMEFTKPADLSSFNFVAGKTYYFRLEGTIPKDSTVEWIPVFYGFELNQWASWTAGAYFGLASSYCGRGVGANSTDVIETNTSSTDYYTYGIYNKQVLIKTIVADYVDSPYNQRGSFFNGSQLTTISGNAGNNVKMINITTGLSKDLFATDAACGIAGVVPEGANTLYWIYYPNGTLVQENTAGVTQGTVRNLQTICGTSWNVGAANTHLCGGMGYNGTDWIVGGNRKICHILADFSNDTSASIGVGGGVGNVSFGGLDGFTLTFNNNNTLYIAHRTAGIEPFYDDGTGAPPASNVNSTLETPLDKASSIFKQQNLTCSQQATVGTLGNVTLKVYYPNGTIMNDTIKNIGGTTNQTSWLINFTYGLEGNYTWNCLVNSSDHTAQDYDTNRTFGFNNTYAYTQEYTPLVLSGSNMSFILHLNVKNITDLSSNVSLWYNNTDYNYTFKEVGAHNINYTTWVVIPTDTIGTNITFWWNYTAYDNVTGVTRLGNTTNTNQTLTNLNMYLCNATYTAAAFNFTMKNEQNFTLVKGDLEANFIFWQGSDYTVNRTFLFNMTDQTNFTFCIFPASLNITGNFIGKYHANNTYSTRYYYMTNTSVSNVTKEITLYNLLVGETTSFKLIVKDSNFLVLKDATIKIQRYYPELDQYIQVEMTKTDENGFAIASLVEKSADYKFIIEKGGSTLYISPPLRVMCQTLPCELPVYITSTIANPYASVADVSNLQWSSTYNKTTNVLTFTFNDLTGGITTARIEAILVHPGKDSSVICNNSASGSSGTITCDLSGYDGTARVNLYISQLPERLVYTFYQKIKAFTKVYGNDGLILSVLLIVSLGLVGIWNPVVGGVLMLCGVLMVSVLGWAAISSTFLMAFVLFLLILIVRFKT